MSKTEDKILVSEIVAKGKGFLKYLLSKWVLLLAVAIIGGGIGFVYFSIKPVKYTATLNFVLSSETRGGLASLASQFGIDVAGQNEGAFSGENIIQLLQSQKIVKRAFFRQVPVQNELLINVIIASAGFNEAWHKNKRIASLIPFSSNVGTLTPVQDSLLSEVYDYVQKNYIKIDRTDKKLSFYSVSTTSTDQYVSAYLTTMLVDEASTFYIETKTSHAKRTLNMLQHEADSLRGLLGGSIEKTAAQADRTFNLNPGLQVERSQVQQGQIRTTVLGAAYGEIIKNLEVAKINLQNETPLYQVIDVPEIPLRAIRPSLVICIFAGMFVLLFITLCFLFFAKALR